MLEHFATQHEALVIFWGFAIEILLSIVLIAIALLEFFYDKNIEESKQHRRKKSKRVKIVIDADGNASIAEAPKGLDVSVEHKGEK